ncbi:hypothetical protein ACFLZ4_01575 [Patescibacteria group bacterium]
MKKFLITVATFIFVILLWIGLGVRSVHKTAYISSATLDIASPMDVTIDVDFIKSLNPAYGTE